jgi:ppGpp synthetase/RelA/SpoT-type nucleotidyltranferase
LTEGVPVELYADLLAKGLIAKEWVPFKGPRGGIGWQSSETGVILYQREKPGERREKAPKPVMGVSLTAEEAMKRLAPFQKARLRTKNPPLPNAPMSQYLSFVHQHAGLAFKGMEKLKDLFPGKPIWGRLKSAESLRAKIERKGSELGVVDIIGTTIITNDYADMDTIRNRISQSFKIEEEQADFLTDPSAGFYRAVHYHVQIDGGSMEIQVMSKRMRQLKEWGHDLIYNGSPQAKNKTYRDYANAWGDYIDLIDAGKKPRHTPECPEEINNNHDCFDTIEHKTYVAFKNLREQMIPTDLSPDAIENLIPSGDKEEEKLNEFNRVYTRGLIASPRTMPVAKLEWKDIPEMEVPIDKIRSRQQWITISLTRAAIRRYSAIPPGNVYQAGDLFWIQNGNHRVSAARLLGEKYIKMKVFKL